MSIWRDGEDDDGTRHYTRYGLFGVRDQFSLTPEERRRGSRRVLLGLAIGALTMGIFGWVGYQVRQDAVGFLVGGIVGCAPLMLTSVVIGIVGAVREGREDPTSRDSD